jgi:hypothetical protein
MNILVPEIWALLGSHKQNGDILENGSKDFDKISVIYRDHCAKWNSIPGIFGKITVRALGSQTQNANFVENYYTDTDYILSREKMDPNNIAQILILYLKITDIVISLKCLLWDIRRL